MAPECPGTIEGHAQHASPAGIGREEGNGPVDPGEDFASGKRDLGGQTEFSETPCPSSVEVCVGRPEEPAAAPAADMSREAGQAAEKLNFSETQYPDSADEEDILRGIEGAELPQGEKMSPADCLETQYPDSADEDEILRGLEVGSQARVEPLQGERTGAVEFSETQYPDTQDEAEVGEDPEEAVQEGGNPQVDFSLLLFPKYMTSP